MRNAARRVTVFGGSGFVGRHVVRRLAARGDVVRVAVRDPVAAAFLKPMGNVGQVVPMRVDIADAGAVAEALRGADAAINLVGILRETGRQRFDAVQGEGAERLAAAARDAGVARFVQVSAIGADAASDSAYGRSKAAGEAGVRRHYPDAPILRPSVVFGPEDDFFNRFAQLAQLAPAVPLVGGGHTRFQPVYVGDVADAVLRALDSPAASGRIYELGGPRTMTFREVIEFVLAQTGRRPALVNLPFGVASMLAAIMEKLPAPQLTRDQVRLLRRDNVAAQGAPGLRELGIEPTPVEAVVPAYLEIYRRGGRYAAGRAA
ncbi:MAG: complex I NDUFA9 subunit family protein [Alphaproteobacteria bacterium]|nr:complex I NDUFA9 subunit family protein [Alphaproteobacteria bacterium]